MKRCAELRDLSDDHHVGLVLARRARRGAQDARAEVVAERWAEVRARFASDLEPHFGLEERLLAPPLEEAGEGALAARLREDHAALRAFVAPAAPASAAALDRFGSALERHIRFEERELFPVAERRLPASALETIARACRERRAGGTGGGAPS